MGEPVRRRQPAQQRSEERVARILDAAAAELGEHGYDGFSTTQVAERSEMSIGSIYRYFPDGRALARALAARNLDRFTKRLLAAVERAGDVDWWRTVDLAIDQFVAMHRDEPGFRAIRFGDAIDQALLDGSQTNNAVVGELFLDFGAELLGIERSPDVDFAVDMAVELVDSLLKRAFLHDPAGDDRVIAECRRIVYLYLCPVLGPSPHGPAAT